MDDLAALWRTLGSRELSRSAASVLATLRDTGPRRITERAEAEALAQPTVTTLVGRLERAAPAAALPLLDRLME